MKRLPTETPTAPIALRVCFKERAASSFEPILKTLLFCGLVIATHGGPRSQHCHGIEPPPAKTNLEPIVITADGSGFQLEKKGQRFVPWGHNYASVDIMRRWEKDPTRVERELKEMKQAGTTVIRIHPEFPRFFKEKDTYNESAFTQLEELVSLADQVGIYLKITGLGCYNLAERMDWYDALPERERWDVQANYWTRVAQVCGKSPAVFAFDLVNEPAAVGKTTDGWYMGEIGGFEFCQRLSLEPGDRTAPEVLQAWTRQMVEAIRKEAPTKLITMGMLPFPKAYESIANDLDFASPHTYPKTGKVSEEIELLKRFSWGKPVVIGETFPLTCSAEEMREYLLASRPHATGWFGHWPDAPPQTLRDRRDAEEATIVDLVWLSWVDLFQELQSEMTGG